MGIFLTGGRVGEMWSIGEARFDTQLCGSPKPSLSRGLNSQCPFKRHVWLQKQLVGLQCLVVYMVSAHEILKEQF